MNINCPHCKTMFKLSDSETNELLGMVRTSEFEKSVDEKVKDLQEKYDAETKAKVTEAVAKEREERNSDVADLKSQISKLEVDLSLADSKRELEVEKAVAAKEKEYSEKLAQVNADNLALSKEVDFYKDLKARQTTKAVGESLELHCENEFNKIRASAFPKAQFGKDNEVSKQSGSKGDYIFRDFDENGMEIISIMFEMKNETQSTASAKKRNDNFFAELDKDRREKNCEYAVLVSLLEPDAEFYNQGIADVSYAYPKMYVIRPQYFVTLISLLRNVALSSAEYKRQVLEYESRNLDLSKFEKDLAIATGAISTDCKAARDNLSNAIDEIDKAIGRLEETKTQLSRSLKRLDKTTKKTEELNLESLTKDNAAVRAQFVSSESEGEA